MDSNQFNGFGSEEATLGENVKCERGHTIVRRDNEHGDDR